MAEPKIAIVHDWFNTRIGGAERVAFALAELFPKAPIYTLIYNQAKFENNLPPSRVRTSFLQKFPKILLSHPKYLLPFLPRAVKGFDFSRYDIVISSSFGFVKNISTPERTAHICYCHTPMRFVWDYRTEYIAELGLGKIRAAIAKLLLKHIRRWDIKGNTGVDAWIANSQNVAHRIHKFYKKNAKIIYPPVDIDAFAPNTKLTKKNYFITASALTPYKKVDILVRAANDGGWNLKVLGEGPQLNSLKKLANQNVEFLGYVSESSKRRLFAEARAFLFAADEDFGIAPVEAMASGTPIIALQKGGLKETVTKKTGIFFEKPTPADINIAINKFREKSFLKKDLYLQAKKFDRKNFNRKITSEVMRVYNKHGK